MIFLVKALHQLILTQTTMALNTCVPPDGQFRYGIHKPEYQVHNLRENDFISQLGQFRDNTPHENLVNFPKDAIDVQGADWIYEIPNPFPFRGTTYITKSWADHKAENIDAIKLPTPPEVSMSDLLAKWQSEKPPRSIREMFSLLPQPVLLALAANSTDPADLTILAEMSCELILNRDNKPTGLVYQKDTNGRVKAIVKNHHLFEIVANNPSLPDHYKEIMVLKPGVQGTSEIVGERQKGDSHIFEYLRSNSYIPWGHYAANMANNSIRYKIDDLSIADINGLRHLYYQRTYTRLAQELDIELPKQRQEIQESDLEQLRKMIVEKISETNNPKKLKFDSTLWGWNFGFDCAASKYRLHASHQMIHQQYAMLPAQVETNCSGKKPNPNSSTSFQSFGCGDLVADFICRYKEENHSDFFDDYLQSLRNNFRMDNNPDRSSSLIIYEDKAVILFVPKAQTSQWELQLMATKQVGNILEADTSTRSSLNKAMMFAMQTLTGLGARMISTIEYPKRFSSVDNSQRLLYSFLPKLPDSPGAFSEAQLRWINGHYPEDFAEACRIEIKKHSQ